MKVVSWLSRPVLAPGLKLTPRAVNAKRLLRLSINESIRCARYGGLCFKTVISELRSDISETLPLRLSAASSDRQRKSHFCASEQNSLSVFP